jgi:chromosome segregation ATPase
MDTSLKSTNNQIKGYDERIAEETRRLEVNTQAKREETNRKLQAAKDKVAEAEAHLKVLENRMREKTEERDAMGQEGVDAEHAMKTAQERVDHCNSMIQKAKEQEQNNLAPYGKDMKRVLGQIDRMKWQGQKPVGPLGVYVKVREPRKWAPLLRSQLGGFMTAFACTDARDRTQLKRLLHDSGKSVFQRNPLYSFDVYEVLYIQSAAFDHHL